MLLQKERELVVAYGKKLITSGLTKGTSGNISIYDRASRLMVISPSGIDYFATQPEDVVVMDLEGRIVEGDRKPSSEHNLHSIFYQNREDVNSVVHTHSVYCTAYASLRRPIRAVHYVIGTARTDVVPCAEYETYGTKELAESCFKACGKGNAVLLANHGMVACGATIQKAFSTADNIEYVAEIQYLSECVGKPVVLDQAEMDRVMKKFLTHGQPKK